MKHTVKNIYLFSMVALFMSIIGLVVSCTPESFVKPKEMQDESKTAGHDKWYKVTFKFREGHTHGDIFHGSPLTEKYEGVKYLATEQELSFELNEDTGEVEKSHNNPIRFIPKTWYAMEIIYYNKEGEVMNEQYTATPELSAVHQHFAIPKNGKDLETGEALADQDIVDVLDYKYRDTEPSDYVRKSETDDSHLRDENDPMGFKGYFYEAQGGISFDLNVLMVHITKGTKRSSSGGAYPFNKPASRMLGVYDLALKIPIHVYTKFGMDGYFDEELWIKDIAKEFNITDKEAKAEHEARIYGGVDNHSSNYYL